MVSELRWVLLVAGIAVIGVVLWLTRREFERKEQALRSQAGIDRSPSGIIRTPAIAVSRRQEDRGGGAMRSSFNEPVNSSLSEEIVLEAIDLDHPAPVISSAALPEEIDQPVPDFTEEPVVQMKQASKPAFVVAPEKVVALFIRAKGTPLWGHQVIDALEREGLRYGKHKIYHRLREEPDGTPAASTVATVFSVANLREPGDLDPSTSGNELPGLALFFTIPGVDDPLASFTDMLSTARRLTAVLSAQLVDTAGCDVSRQRADHLRDELIQFQHQAHQASLRA